MFEDLIECAKSLKQPKKKTHKQMGSQQKQLFFPLNKLNDRPTDQIERMYEWPSASHLRAFTGRNIQKSLDSLPINKFS